MENKQPISSKPPVSPLYNPFSFATFFLWMILSIIVGVILAIMIPFVLFAKSGFAVHGPSPKGGPAIYWLFNLGLVAYAACKRRDAALDFFAVH